MIMRRSVIARKQFITGPTRLQLKMHDDERFEYDLLELFVFVLHKNRAVDNIDDADTVSSTCGDLGRRFVPIIGVGFKDHVPDLCLNISRIIIFAVRTNKVNWIKGKGIGFFFALFLGRFLIRVSGSFGSFVWHFHYNNIRT